MHFTGYLWSAITCLTSYLSFSPVYHYEAQQPFVATVSPGPKNETNYPKFKPPGGRLMSDFECKYPNMTGWKSCSTQEDRGCWLYNPETGQKFDTMTDYEKKAPIGIDRYYELDISVGDWNTDGILSKNMTLVNNKYPGQWIEACWGDRIIVKVNNNLQFHGTAIHWHGLRQNQSMHMDGVPGITQCPIAPGDHFVYNFSTVQYGSSWYHSHYSVQYADGLLGPLTIHGPSPGDYDEAKMPILMSDWFHKSAYDVIHEGYEHGNATILLNGIGNVLNFNYTNDTEIPPKYTLQFEKRNSNPPYMPKRYLLRLINTSFSTTFVFSIDNHRLIIIGADFVPVNPTPRSHILVGIGQRYNVIVTADPVAYLNQSAISFDCYSNVTASKDTCNFWIRTSVPGCFSDGPKGIDGYNMTGILRYNNESNLLPTTEHWPGIDETCRDETDLTPVLPWNVGPPANGDVFGQRLDLTLDDRTATNYPLAWWSLDQTELNSSYPFQINYTDPIFLHLDNMNPGAFAWNESWVVIPENYTADDWVYLALAGVNGMSTRAHPIHLHGHDFAILDASVDKPLSKEVVKLVTNNPIRRDVALLYKNGYLIIAFKADNPGSWLMHCHIAFHAAEGLALQVLERQADADRIWPKRPQKHIAIKEAERVCANWDSWYADCRNYSPGYNATDDCWPSCPKSSGYGCNGTKTFVFMDDSGI